MSNSSFWKTNHAECTINVRIEVVKCLTIFIYTANIYLQDRETIFTKTFKTSEF